jgi:hypothetical protein
LSQDERQYEAEALVRLSQTQDGQIFLRILNREFDEAMRVLLGSPPDQIMSRQGAAVAYQKMLKKFVDAKAMATAAAEKQ